MAFRLGIVMKLWGRPAVSAFVMRQLAGLDLPGVELACVAVRSPGDPDPAPDVDGWHYVTAPNRPLSPKGNAAVQALRVAPLGPVDAVLNVGSDDLVSAGYALAAVRHIEAGIDLVLPDGLCLLDLVSPAEGGRLHAMAVRAPRIGAGRVLGRALLDRLDWRPWPDHGDDPDADMDARLIPSGTVTHAFVRGADVDARTVVCDVKCGDNIGSYDGIRRRRLEEGMIADVYPDDLLHALSISPSAFTALMNDFKQSRQENTAPGKSLRRVIQNIKINGKWYRPGTDQELVEVTPEEARVYAHALAAPQDSIYERPDGRPRADVEASQKALEAAGIPGAAPQPPTVPGEGLPSTPSAEATPPAATPPAADVEASQEALEEAGIPGAAPQEPMPPPSDSDAVASRDLPYEDRSMTARKPTAPAKPKEEPSIEHVGGGWYQVRKADGTVEKVQGKDAAERLAAKG